MPIYSTHWFVQTDATPLRAGVTGGGVSYAWGAHLIERSGGTIQWDNAQQVSYGSAMVGGVNQWVYFDDVRSFRAQMALAREFSLRGVSAWVLGMEDERIWNEMPAGR